jgi:hypothetical protein
MFNAVDAGANQWNSSSANVHFTATGITSSSTDIYINDYGATDWAGQTDQVTSPYDCPYPGWVPLECNYLFSIIQMNGPFVYGYSYRTGVTSHELGHSIGLHHPDTADASVMLQGMPYFWPSWYDVVTINMLYPPSWNG